MGVSTATNGKKMKTLCILLVFGATLIKAHENDFEVVVNDKSYLERSFCCLTTNAQSTCATNCANKDCAASCTVRCGIFMSVCGTYTCSAVAASSCTTTTTTTTTTAASVTCTCVPTGCTENGSSSSNTASCPNTGCSACSGSTPNCNSGTCGA